MDSLSNKLSLIRILRAVMFNEAHLIEVLYKLIFAYTLFSLIVDNILSLSVTSIACEG